MKAMDSMLVRTSSTGFTMRTGSDFSIKSPTASRTLKELNGFHSLIGSRTKFESLPPSHTGNPDLSIDNGFDRSPAKFGSIDWMMDME